MKTEEDKKTQGEEEEVEVSSVDLMKEIRAMNARMAMEIEAEPTDEVSRTLMVPDVGDWNIEKILAMALQRLTDEAIESMTGGAFSSVEEDEELSTLLRTEGRKTESWYIIDEIDTEETKDLIFVFAPYEDVSLQVTVQVTIDITSCSFSLD